MMRLLALAFLLFSAPTAAPEYLWPKGASGAVGEE